MAEIHQRVEAIRRLARKGATSALGRTIDKSRAEDVAAATRSLVPAQIRMVFAQIHDDDVAAEVLTRVDAEALETLVAEISFERLVSLLDLMEVDDEADVIARLPAELAQRVLGSIEGEDKEKVEDILGWPEDSAGGIMQPVAFRLSEQLTCRDAISALHEQHEGLEMVFYIYVENEAEQLVGVTSLRALLTHAPSTALKDIMETEVISVPPETDQEEVARIVSRYDLLAIPVVDTNRRLLGIITIDDVVDVIKEEAAEDMMLMAGVGDDVEALTAGVMRSLRQRMPWLVVTLFSGLAISEIIGHFTVILQKELILAGFMPIIMGMGGNVGTQAATIAVRNIALGIVGKENTARIVWREARVGFLMGLCFALALGAFIFLRHGDIRLPIAIAIAGQIQLLTAAVVGTLVPFLMHRLRVDPAVATGPVVSTGLDLLGVTVYFIASTLILGL